MRRRTTLVERADFGSFTIDVHLIGVDGLFFKLNRRLRSGRQNAGVEAGCEISVLLLVGEIDQVAKFRNDLLGAMVVAFGGLNGLLMLAIAEAHDLDITSVCAAGAPVGADLFVDFELVAPDSGQGLAEASNQAGMLGAAFFWDNVAVGLQEHEAFFQKCDQFMLPHEPIFIKHWIGQTVAAHYVRVARGWSKAFKPNARTHRVGPLYVKSLWGAGVGQGVCKTYSERPTWTSGDQSRLETFPISGRLAAR